jgi:hypothetical protein
MNLRLILLDRFMPECIKTAKIKELFALTAAAFEVETPDLSGKKYGELLKEYACFAKKESDTILPDAQKTSAVRGRLYKGAVETGLQLKHELKIKSYDEVLIASRIFYRILGIEFFGDTSGNITIRKCFFSNYLSAENCCLISALDEGVAQGLSQGELKFTQRITDGNECCMARIRFAIQAERGPDK